MMIKLSVAIITLNEERNIERCIKSILPIADEIIVVDSNSKDATVEIAQNLGARIVYQSFLGYIEQKNFAMQKASYDHVLAIDADEALSPELCASILAIKQNFDADAYKMNRLTNYCGQWIHHSGWYPDTKIRLFKRGAGIWKGTNPHDRFELYAGKSLKKLKGDIHHYSYYTRQQHLDQIIKFSNISSKAKYDQGIRSNWFKLLTKPPAKFIKSYLLKQGFRDGYAGWIIATYSAYATYLKYYKLLVIQRSE